MKKALMSAVLALNTVTIPAYAGDIEEQIATVLNLNGHLCATVTDVRPLRQADTYEVTCIEYRGGTGKVRYILQARTGIAYKAG